MSDTVLEMTGEAFRDEVVEKYSPKLAKIV